MTDEDLEPAMDADSAKAKDEDLEQATDAVQASVLASEMESVKASE